MLKRFIVALFLSVVSLGALAADALSISHTAFPTPDGTANFGLFKSVEQLNTAVNVNSLSKLVVNNNSTTPYTIPNDTAYVLFTGTQAGAGTMTINLPAAASSRDSQEITIFTAGAIGTALTVASSGATVVGTPATLAANSTLKYKYDAATTQWIVIGH